MVETKETTMDYSSMKVDALRTELKARNLPSSGNKPDLIERLQQSDSGEITQDVPQEQTKKADEALQQTLVRIEEVSTSLQVQNPKDFQDAATARQDIKKFIDLIAELFDDNIATLHKAHKDAIAKRKKYLDPAKAADKRIQLEMERYVQEEKRAQIAKHEEEQRQARETAKQKIAADANQALASGDMARAKELFDELAAIEQTPPMAIAPQITLMPNAEGAQVKEPWTFEIVDASKIKNEFMIPAKPDMQMIMKMVKSRHEAAEEVVGKGSIRVYQDVQIARTSS